MNWGTIVPALKRWAMISRGKEKLWLLASTLMNRLSILAA